MLKESCVCAVCQYVALQCLLLSELPGMALYICVVGHTCLSEMQEKLGNQLQADFLLVYRVFQ